MKIEDFKLITNGNTQAEAFLLSYLQFCHLIDDIVDKDVEVDDKRLVQELLGFLEQCTLNPWASANFALLWPLITCAAYSWLDSNRWAKTGTDLQKQSVDTLKGQYHEVFWFTANLCGGREHQQNITSRFRQYDYEQQTKD